jgi:Ca2+-binding EF-hand superfamily protein
MSKMVSEGGTRNMSKMFPVRRGSKEVAGVGRRPSKEAAPAPMHRDEADVPVVRQLDTETSANCDMMMQCFRLAREYHLEVNEVKHIVKSFQDAAKNASGGIEMQVFERIMMRIFDVKSIKVEICQGAYGACVSEQKGFDLEAFLVWYVQNMFTAVANLRGDADMIATEKQVFDVAQKTGCSTKKLDEIMKVFRSYDTDGSGVIDYEEFVAMLSKLLASGNTEAAQKMTAEALSDKKVRGWWTEIDADGSGEVDYAEFTQWYLKYFKNGSLENGIMEAFYDSFNPSQQRAQAMVMGG